MAILIDNDTKLLVQGLTGRGSFHAGRNRDYGTQLVAGVTPGKGGIEVNGTPVFDTVEEAVKRPARATSMVFVPARFAAGAVLESYDGGIDTIIAITENIPANDMRGRCRRHRTAELEGDADRAELSSVISPGKANVGIIPGEICSPGSVGLVSRSGTLVYQIVHELTQKASASRPAWASGATRSSSDFIDILSRFEADPETEMVVMVGEIGGEAESAAEWAAANMTKPIVGYIAGLTAPPGKRMGPAGAIISGSKGNRAGEDRALEGQGRVGPQPDGGRARSQPRSVLRGRQLGVSS